VSDSSPREESRPERSTQDTCPACSVFLRRSREQRGPESFPSTLETALTSCSSRQRLSSGARYDKTARDTDPIERARRPRSSRAGALHRRAHPPIRPHLAPPPPAPSSSPSRAHSASLPSRSRTLLRSLSRSASAPPAPSTFSTLTSATTAARRARTKRYRSREALRWARSGVESVGGRREAGVGEETAREARRQYREERTRESEGGRRAHGRRSAARRLGRTRRCARATLDRCAGT